MMPNTNPGRHIKVITAAANFTLVGSTMINTSGGSTLGTGGTGPQILSSPPPQFVDTVVLLPVELIGSIVNFA